MMISYFCLKQRLIEHKKKKKMYVPFHIPVLLHTIGVQWGYIYGHDGHDLPFLPNRYCLRVSCLGIIICFIFLFLFFFSRKPLLNN